MPRIYELPAGAGPSSESLVFEHAPGSPTAQRFNPQQQQQPQGSADPRQMMAQRMDAELNNVTREFDSQVGLLDQQQLEPDQYKRAYANLQSKAMNQRVAIQAKHQAAAQQIKNMQKLVKDDLLAPKDMEATMLVMAGVPTEHVRKMFAQREQQKPMTRIKDLKYIADRMEMFRSNFTDKSGRLYLVDGKGKKLRSASEAEEQEYQTTALRLREIDKEMWNLYNEVSPIERDSISGMMAMRKHIESQRPSTFSKVLRSISPLAFAISHGPLANIIKAKQYGEQASNLAANKVDAAKQEMPQPRSEAEYNALPKGAKYVHPDGTIRTKK